MKALAREHGVAPRTIRRVLDAAGARELPDDVKQFLEDPAHIENQEQVAADQRVTIDIPGLLAEHLLRPYHSGGDGAAQRALHGAQEAARRFDGERLELAGERENDLFGYRVPRCTGISTRPPPCPGSRRRRERQGERGGPTSAPARRAP
ncbi:hypothetical protein ACQP2T_60595 [Nonomuraea sp. CA-143628]|uniref:hypothetical protein n=1 Tax=Nonomuraea sp. CA-143628 TaxID=3239997 RepID=UPI003D93BBB2